MFKGSFVALVTPFQEDGTINFETLGTLVDLHVKYSDGIVVNGTTAEAATLSEEEQLSIIEFVNNRVNKRIPVVAGTGSNNTLKAISFSKKVSTLGVDGLLIVNPYYNKGNVSGIYKHYELIAEAVVPTPILLYNVPSRTGSELSLEVISKLAHIPNIVGIKEASGNIEKIANIIKSHPEFLVFSGNDDQIFDVLSNGGHGVISVFANICPDKSKEIVDSYLSGDVEGSKGIQEFYTPFINSLFIEVNPIPIKEIMNYHGYNVGGYRLPLDYMSIDNRNALIDEYKKVEVLRWSR